MTRQHMLSNDYEVFHYSNRQLSDINLHHHDCYECYFFISGNVTYLIEGKAYTLMPGDIVLINSKELHQAIINNKAMSYDRIVLWINRSFLKDLSTSKSDLTSCFESPDKRNVIRADFDVQQNIKSLFHKLLNLEDYEGIGSDLLYKSYIIELMVLLNQLSFNTEPHSNIDIKKSNLIDGVIEYINEHIDGEITIDDLSECFYLSKYHLLREFKKQTGTTIHRYIVQKKLIQAKELILKQVPIISVYKQCGFGDYSNFFRAFKNEYGVTPKQFYELMRNGSSA